MADEVQSSFVPSVYRFPPPPRELSAKLKLIGTGSSLQPGPKAGPTGLLHPPVGAAVRHESSSVPAACSLASEMQRLRGEVSSRSRRVAVGVAPMGKMAAGFRGDRSVRGCRTVTPGIVKGPRGLNGYLCLWRRPAVAEGTRGKGMRKWQADSFTSVFWLSAGQSPACPFWVATLILPVISTKASR